MSIAAELSRALELFEFPFMQRALIGGVFTGLTGGLLGSFTILRQLSFFSDALGHSALLGISFAFLLGFNPSAIILPFAVIFALVVMFLLERTHLWTDALLNIVYSSSLAVALIVLSFVGQYKGGINHLLFGDILAIRNTDLILSAVVFCLCTAFIGLTLRSQMLLTANEPMAIARGVPVATYRTIFIVLLSLLVGVSIKAIGVLLVSAFIVIPACAARLLSRNFTHHVLASAGLGALSAILGILLSALFNLPSGPSIVVMQLAIFCLALFVPTVQRLAS